MQKVASNRDEAYRIRSPLHILPEPVSCKWLKWAENNHIMKTLFGHRQSPFLPQRPREGGRGGGGGGGGGDDENDSRVKWIGKLGSFCWFSMPLRR